MKRTIFLLVTLTIISAGASYGQQKKLVGNIKSKHGSACADFFTFARQSPYSPKLMFYSSAGDEEDTWMNIDGQDVRLKMVSRTEPTKPDSTGGESVGSRTTEKYTAGNITVEIFLTVSWLCPVNNPDCESIGYRAVFKVRKGKQRQTVKAKGVFGC